MLRLQKLNNATLEDEFALINVDTKELIMRGDYYHDKIVESIQGFFRGLDYAGVQYEKLDTLTVTPDMELFSICDFYLESDWEDDCEDTDEEISEPLCDIPEDVEEQLPLHLQEHNFVIAHAEGEEEGFYNIVEALQETRKCEGDLFYYNENEKLEMVYSCLGLGFEANNNSLKKFGVQYDDNNKLIIL